MADQAPRQDNFASLQAVHNSPVPPQEGEGQVQEAPKRDKFASMAARQQQSTPAATTLAPAPAPAPSTGTTGASVPPRRDKFASMTARQQVAPETSTIVEPPGTATATTPTPKRDKFASMALATAISKRDESTITSQATTQPKRDKFASMAQQQKSPPSGQTTPKRTAAERMKALEKRTQQRQKVLKDLEKAEGHTWNLIQFASKTARHLTKLKVEDDDTTLSEISSKYRDTLQKIHSLLSPHAKFVKAYQNHQEESEATNMYAARVETRLAQERRNVLEELLRLEKQEAPQDINNENKRKRED